MEHMQTTTTHRGILPANGAASARKETLMGSITSIITLASAHAGANSSAEFSLREARERIAEGNTDAARYWALRSLAHSVGVFHADYASAAA